MKSNAFFKCSIIVAASLWAAGVAAAVAPNGPPDNQIEAAQNIAQSLDKIANDATASKPLEQKCNPGTDDRDSDLCAQWKAADAATALPPQLAYKLCLARSASWVCWLRCGSTTGLGNLPEHSPPMPKRRLLWRRQMLIRLSQLSKKHVGQMLSRWTRSALGSAPIFIWKAARSILIPTCLNLHT